MTNKGMKKMMAVGMLATMAAGTLGASAVFADNGEVDEERMQLVEEIKEAIDNNDYESFIEALTEFDSKAAEKMNEDVFTKIVDRHDLNEDIKEAVSAGDYDLWTELVNELPNGEALISVIDQDEFDSLQELYEAREVGDKETAKEIADEIGLTEFREERKEIREEKREKRMEVREGIIQALDAEDYQAWLVAIADTPAAETLTEVINEDNFGELVEIHELRESGEHEEAKEAAEELGLPMPEHKAKELFHKIKSRFAGLFR